jgi:hypothetical protein
MRTLSKPFQERATIRAKFPTSGRIHQRPPRPIGLRRVRIGKRIITTEGIARAIFQDLFHYFMTVGWPQLTSSLVSSITWFRRVSPI